MRAGAGWYHGGQAPCGDHCPKKDRRPLQASATGQARQGCPGTVVPALRKSIGGGSDHQQARGQHSFLDSCYTVIFHLSHLHTVGTGFQERCYEDVTSSSRVVPSVMAAMTSDRSTPDLRALLPASAVPGTDSAAQGPSLQPAADTSSRSGSAPTGSGPRSHQGSPGRRACLVACGMPVARVDTL